MIVLLDTHTFIWWDNSPSLLSSKVHSIICDSQNTVLLSVVSIWEMQIKQSLSKLTLRAPLHQVIDEQILQGISVTSIDLHDVMAVGNLPALHKDPFDRMLVSQAIARNIPILSKDIQFQNYPVQVIW